MVQSHSLIRFDLPRQLLTWLNISARCKRKGRLFLETHLSLLANDPTSTLQQLVEIIQTPDGQRHEQYLAHLALLQDIQARGCSLEAIREAYINHFGASALDLPNWLADLEKRRLVLQNLKRPDRTNRKQIAILQHIIHRLEHGSEMPQELLADYQNTYGVTLLESSHFQSHRSIQHALESAIRAHQQALSIFCEQRYPLQYALTKLYIGVAYQRYSLLGHQHMLELAIECYQAALARLHEDEHREQWIFLHLYLSHAFTQYAVCHGMLYLDQAFSYIHAIQPFLQEEEMAFFRALTAVHLGDAYRAQRHPTSLQLALDAYREAARFYQNQPHTPEGAGTHLKMAGIYQHLSQHYPEQKIHYLRCGVICCEQILETYTIVSYPIEYGHTYSLLGNLHLQLAQAQAGTSIEEAHHCFREALRVFTRGAFPRECEQLVKTMTALENIRHQQISM